MSAKRDRLEIIHDILQVIQEKGERIRPTHILYKSNLSHQMLTAYMTELIEKGFVEERRDKKGKKSFALTNKGFGYLKDYSLIRGFMESYGLN